jgi:hypothetical protein
MQNTTSNTTPSSEPSSVRARAEDTATKAAERVQSATEHAVSVASDKAHAIRDQVQTAAEKLSAGRVEDGVRGVREVVDAAKGTLTHATEQGARLLHEGRDAALDGYHSARDYAVDTAYDVGDRARCAGYRTARYARRASEQTGHFLTVHALPLTVVGAGLGWLAWSIRREAQRSVEREPASLASSLETRPSYRNDYESSRVYQGSTPQRGDTLSRANTQTPSRTPYGEQDDPRLANMTTSGNKLMGVRTGRLYEE